MAKIKKNTNKETYNFIFLENILEKIITMVICIVLYFIDLRDILKVDATANLIYHICILVWIFLTILFFVIIIFQYKKGKYLTPNTFSFIKQYIFKK